MVLYFVKTAAAVATPSDANDGQDPLGIGLATAAYDDLGHGDGDHRVYQSGAFSGYTWTAGDRIYTAAGGTTGGLYEIASKVSNDVILTVESISGGGDSAGNVLSSSGPKATIAGGMSPATNGDTVVICDDGTHSPTDYLSISGTGTSMSANYEDPICFQGADARGVIDGTRPTIDTDATNTYGFATFTSNYSAVFKDLVITGKESGSADTSNNSLLYLAGGGAITTIRCRLTNCYRHAIQWTTTYACAVLVETEIDNIRQAGTHASSTSNGVVQMFGCSVHDTDTGGLGYAGVTTSARTGGCVLVDTNIYGNGGPGLILAGDDGVNAKALISGCNFVSNGGSGIEINSAVGSEVNSIAIVNCTFKNNGAYGLKFGSADPRWSYVVENCCWHNNTSGDSDDDIPGSGHVYDDPDFVSLTDGSEDFDLDTGSPCLAAGLQAPEA